MLLVVYTQCESVCVNSSFCVFVHRAPVLVAIALIENGMKYHDAIDTIRRSVSPALLCMYVVYVPILTAENVSSRDLCEAISMRLT